MNWKQQIEAQIAAMRETGVQAYTWNGNSWPDTMQALLDVAVAAEEITEMPTGEPDDAGNMKYVALVALDKLREVSDE